MEKGSSTSFEKHPCPNEEEEDDSSNPNNGGGGTSETGTSDGADTGSGNTDGSNSNSGQDSGSGTANCTSCIECEWEINTPENCNCMPNVVIICPDSTWGEDKSMSSMFRHPCDDEPNDCAGQNDCEFGWDEDCNCLDDPNENNEVAVLFDDQFIEKCEELNKLTDNQDIKNKINDLKSDLFANPDNRNEKGFRLFATSGNDVNSDAIDTGGAGEFPYHLTEAVFGGVHTHPKKGLFPMFSVADILSLHKFWITYDNPNVPININKSVHILVTQQGTYALKIDNLPQLAIFNAAMMNTNELDKKETRLEGNYYSLYNQQQNQLGNSFDHMKAFLKFLEKYSIGVSMYKASDDLSSWTKKELNETGNDIVDKNCN
jgi:hypothetical protein